jgi:hypothetical protein
MGKNRTMSRLTTTFARSTLVGVALSALLGLAACSSDWGGSVRSGSATTSTPTTRRSTTTRPTTTTTRPTTTTTRPTTTTTRPTTTTTRPTTTTTTAPLAGACTGTPGAGAGATTRGETTYAATGTTTVSNVIFDGNHSDDLVRVNNGKVIFDHVTFRGNGTGTFGHTLEIKQGGSAEVRNSVFEGNPFEDTIQTENNGATLIECNRIGGTPHEDHVDTKTGASVTIRNNAFTSAAAAQTIENHNHTNPVHLINNTGMRRVFYEEFQTGGTIVGNSISEYIWLYDVSNILVQGNTVPIAKHGDSGTQDPTATYFKDNNITTFQFNGGTCFKTGSNGASLPNCTTVAPPWYSP